MTATAWAIVVGSAVVVLLMARFVRAMGDVFALARAGHVHRLRALLDHDRALATARNKDGETPLHHAAKYGELEAIRVLLAHGADVNARTPVGATPLHMARAFSEDAAVDLLVASGADATKEPVFMNLGGGDVVTAVPDDDPDMLSAVAKARAELPTLRALHRERPDAAAIKFAFTADSGTVEHLWAELVELGEETMRVRVKTPPATHKGPFEVERTLPVSELEDWQVELPDGNVRGGFGYGVIFARAKKDLGALPPEIEEQEQRFVDLR